MTDLERRLAEKFRKVFTGPPPASLRGRAKNVAKAADPVAKAAAKGGAATVPPHVLAARKAAYGLPLMGFDACAYRGPVAYEVPCRICSQETVMRPVYLCSLYGVAMRRRNEHGMADCSRCEAREPKTGTTPV